MKTIIAGSRDYENKQAVFSILDRCPWQITEVVCGEAKGPDTIGKEWAEQNNIPVKSFPADWDQHGKSAGPTRNKAMAQYSEAVIVFWDGVSRGARNMINQTLDHKLHLLVVQV